MSHEELLEELRRRYRYATEAWREIRAEAAEDMRFISGDPWDPREKQRRFEAGRPALHLDQITQYTNSIVNQVRQSKRSIMVTPQGSGNEDDAEVKQNLIRTIEYKSKAQAVYSYVFENIVHRSYGFAKIVSRYVNDESFDQELYIVRIPNPDSVTIDPDFKEADASDIEYAFIEEFIPREEFKRRWPNAREVSFEMAGSLYGDWVREHGYRVAEYWYVEKREKTLLLMDNGSPEGVKMFREDLPQGTVISRHQIEFQTPAGPQVFRLVSNRTVIHRKVRKVITNGVEILEQQDWPGRYIPLACAFGRELWVPEGSGVKRIFTSLARNARHAQMMYNYARSTETELIGQIPKAPFVGAAGQFAGFEKAWRDAATVPTAFLEYNPVTDLTGNAILPPPQRPDYHPPIQALEILSESARQDVRNAMGISSLPTPAARLNEKSGVALERIQQAAETGTYHFVDNFERFLEHVGRMLNDLIPHFYDTPRELALRGEDEVIQKIKINQAYIDRDGKMRYYDLKGDYDVTVATGPSYQSQREQAGEFVKHLVTPEMLGAAIAGNPKAAKIAALSIRLQNGGPIMDHIAEVLDPEHKDPAQAQVAAAALVERLKQMEAAVAELAKRADENAAKERMNIRDNRTRLAIEAMKLEGEAQRAFFEAHMHALNQELAMAAEASGPPEALQTPAGRIA